MGDASLAFLILQTVWVVLVSSAKQQGGWTLANLGDYSVLVSSFEELQIVDEGALSWGQVLDFHADRKARESYRRFIHWFDQTLIGKDAGYVRDELEQRLKDYSEAMRHYSVKTTLGTL